jgi:hypothetical protein
VGRLIPSRSGPYIAPGQHFATEDNMNDLGNPYAGAHPNGMPTPPVPADGCQYGPIASFHNARATGAPMAPRTARTQAYVTPHRLWNLSGIASGFIQVLKAPVVTTKLATGRWTPVAGSAVAPLPGLPEPAQMVRPRRP